MLTRLFRIETSTFAVYLLFASIGYAQRPAVETYRHSLSPYVTSPQRVVDKMLDMANLKPGEKLYDLGCGDGRILIAAAQRFKAKAVGVEISNRLVKSTTETIKSMGLQDQITIIHGDMLKADLSDADVVTLYLLTTANAELRPHLERDLKPNSRIVSYEYPVPGWTAMEIEKTPPSKLGYTHSIYLYQVPDSLNKPESKPESPSKK